MIAAKNPARGRYPAQAREGADYPSLNLTLDIGKHSPVDPKAGDVVADNLADQRRIVMIGRPFAVPFLWIPAHNLCAAAKREATSTA